jgi:hypothetical protein
VTDVATIVWTSLAAGLLWPLAIIVLSLYYEYRARARRYVFTDDATLRDRARVIYRNPVVVTTDWDWTQLVRVGLPGFATVAFFWAVGMLAGIGLEVVT